MFGAPLQSLNGQFCGVEGDVAFEDVSCFEALPLQMPSDGYCDSNGLNLGRGSSCVLTYSHSDPPAQRRWDFFGSTTWFFLYHNPEDLLRNAKWLSYCVQPQQRWHVVRGLVYAVQQSYHVQRRWAFLPLPSRDLHSVITWQEMTWNPNFCTDFGF